ncbi:MAG: 50S ribosomal protein L6 [Planctomycetota bacterium]|nr:50S ribosomal protein L6 [Planctomycetota bacterium]
MSRLGKKPIVVPANVKVDVTPEKVSVSSGNKTLALAVPAGVRVAFDQGSRHLSVTIPQESVEDRQARAHWGTTRAHLQNMVTGVSTGFQKQLEVVGVGYTAVVAGKTLDLKLGFANLIKVPIPMGVEVSVEKQMITVKGADRQAVGQFAAVVRSKRKPEPYNGKGVKYTTETIRRKQGKAFGS